MIPNSDDDGADPHFLTGVRFALVGFDQLSAPQYRMEMERAGATDAGDWDGDCTHVIVYGRLYDDPLCVAARNGGKKVVTEQWVNDCLDLGELVDADRVLYAPLRGFSGIPGSESLLISLTGYQKAMREEIMKMVSLMGAQFSRTLVANQVTHLICYKFEGEKYNAAKQVRMKIVNHRWLEDCLKAWEILPIDNYKKSGWEIEIMETEVKDSEDEMEDAGRGSSSNIRINRSTPVTEIKTRSTVDSDVNAPTRAPIVPSSNAEGAAGRHSGNARNRDSVTVSVDSGASPCGNDEVPANQVSRGEVEDDHNRAPETRATALCTPSIHKSNTTPIQVDNIEHNDANCLHNYNKVALDNICWANPSEDNLSRTTLPSLESSKKVEQKEDRNTPYLKSTVRQSFVEEKLKLYGPNLRSEGNSTLQNNHTVGYSRRHSSKSVSPDTNLNSAQKGSSPQSSQGNTSRIEFCTPQRQHDQEFNEHVDSRSLQKAEVVKHVDVSSNTLAQRRTSILSSVSPKSQNGDPGSRTGLESRLISSMENASEEATVSNQSRNSAGCTKIDSNYNSVPTVKFTEKQMSGSFKSNLLSSRRTSLKLVSSNEEKRLPQNFSVDKNLGLLGEVKTPALRKATNEKDCAICPSFSSEVRKESSRVSHQNGNTGMSDAEQVDKVDVAAPSLKSDKVIPHQSLEAGPSDIPVQAIVGQDSKTHTKVSTSRVRNSGAKRSRNAGGKTAKRKPEVAASKPMDDEAVSRENANTQQGEKCSSPNNDESSLPNEEISNGKPGNEASKSELVNLIPQKNMKEDNKKLSSSECAENLEKTSKKVPDSLARNSVAEGLQSADGKSTDSVTAEKPGSMPLESNFNEVPPENRETYPKKLSSSASADEPETCTASEVQNSRPRKVVAKRKLSAVQKQKFGSDPHKPASVFVTEDKSSEKAAQSSRNAGKVTVDQVVQNTSEDKTNDPVGPILKDNVVDTTKDIQNSKRQKAVDLVGGSLDHDKENIPVSRNLYLKTKSGNNGVSSKVITEALGSGKVVLAENNMIKRNGRGNLDVLEPTWFILSGHRLLRKEYKSILKRLKGRVCRDSHNWSFQATHFVATELRRTEKFFAAAAAGRWILKPDYLTACNEAGKFLEEEPFEWHGHGLNGSETISLDAPRKWRQQKQRTGHGAFYGMQIIIYGECIAPTLDTLKRVIRAGDGTILATSPPYTRIFKSNVDFAVVSTGMPSVDAWVQEFMRHKIPCISPDYLVEYVCKPGNSLNKHVLFEMYDLAEKSLEKVMKLQHDGITGEEAGADDLCSNCGSSDRDRPMLVCGSDGNSAGCGIVVHVDCCNPAVEAGARAGEWLCTKCDESRPAKKARKSGKSGGLQSR